MDMTYEEFHATRRQLEVEMIVLHDGLTLAPQTGQLRAMMTTLRDETTSREIFIRDADRVIQLLTELTLAQLPTRPKLIQTPLASFWGEEFVGSLVAVPILRAGLAMLSAVRSLCEGIRVGSILIQRDEQTAEPQFIYQKMPPDLQDRTVIILDPMLATGGSVIATLRFLQELGVAPEQMLFMNLICCPDGLQRVFTDFPQLRIITAAIDEQLDEKSFIVPGLGDFGDRYFGTE